MSFIETPLSNSYEKLEEISVFGKVVAFSHTFRTLNGLVFFIELLSGQKLIHVVVNISCHLFWSQLVEYGSSYSISYLCRNVLWKQSHNVEVFVVTEKSELLLLKRSSCLEECKEQSLANFEGFVTEVVNDHLGIFKINGETTLLLPYLIGLVTEFSEEKSHFFKVGDHVLVLNAHKINGNDGNSTLLCCGRSFVRNISAPQIPCSSDSKRIFSDNGIIHCLHKYNLGIEFFYWLCNLEEILTSSVPFEINPESIIRREYNGRKGALSQFISRLADFKTIKPVKRSILEEFLLKDHNCSVLGEFQQPFCPNLIDLIATHQPDNNITNVLWTHHVIKKKEHNWVIFGILKLTEEGFVKLITNVSSILVVFLDGKHNIYNKLNKLVAIINFDWVEETFSVYRHENDDLRKRYIIVRSTNILSLLPSSLSKIIKGASFKIKILSKSGLYFSHDGNGSFFICNANVTYLDSYISREENWQTLLCFRGHFSKLYPCISNKTGIKGKIMINNNSEYVAFRKKRSFAWLRSTYNYFGTTECVDLPETYEIENIENCTSSAICYSVLDVLESKCDDKEAITVEGLVTKRLLVSPLFKSENFNLTASLLNHQIGIPGSKILRFYLQDFSHSHATICIYVNSGTESCYLRQYPLGIIPGVKLRITWLKKNISKQCNTYLMTTNFTTICIISQIGPHNSIDSSSEYTGKRKYISQISLLKHSTIVTLCVTISSIIVIDLKMVCPFCESDFKNGRCDYVGCHAVDKGTLTGSAKFVVDDGTGVSIVLTKDLEHVKILCNLSLEQWETFTAIIGERPVSLCPKYKLKDSQDSINNLSLLLNSSQILRPVLLTCRTFNQRSIFSPNLFLLHIKPLNCNADWKSILC